MKTCEKCKKDHDGTFASGRFCSRACANSKIQTSEANKKKSETLKKRNADRMKRKMQKTCIICGSYFEHLRRKTCSKECVAKDNLQPEIRQRLSEKGHVSAMIRHDRGDDFGWRSRKKMIPSFPEEVAIRHLDHRGINYERECKVGKYFIDFALHKRSIAIEIDGQQHEKPERKMSDLKKDEFLTSKGWKVFRIKWPNENIIQSIDKILNQ